LRKPSGGRIRFPRKKRRYELGREPVYTHVAPLRKKVVRVRGGNKKIKLLRADEINVYNPKTGKSEKAKIVSVIENPANPHFAHRNIITKGAIVETSLGKVKVTSRPGQHGVLNGVLLE
jgi:small subunit ribosomal protein S8e